MLNGIIEWCLMGLLSGGLKNKGECGRIIDGSVAEWLKAHDSKSCGRVTVSEVRILSLPPKCFIATKPKWITIKSH